METSNFTAAKVAAALPLNWLFPNNQRKAAAMKLTQNQLCEAIRAKTLLEIIEPTFDESWTCIPRLIGRSPDGVVLVYQTLGASKALSRDTHLAGDGWRRNTLSLINCYSAAKIDSDAAKKAKSAAKLPIPERMRQSIYEVLFEG